MTSDEMREMIYEATCRHQMEIASWIQRQIEEFGPECAVVYDRQTTAWPVLSAVIVYMMYDENIVAAHLFEIRICEETET